MLAHLGLGRQLSRIQAGPVQWIGWLAIKLTYGSLLWAIASRRGDPDLTLFVCRDTGKRGKKEQGD